MKKDMLVVFILVLCFVGCVPSVSDKEAASDAEANEQTVSPDISESSPPDMQVTASASGGQCVEVAVQDNRIYFINRYDKSNLYSMNIDGSDKRKLGDDWLNRFYLSGDQIYYVNNAGGGNLYAMNIDGGDKRKLSDDYIVSVFWNVYDGRIYYDNWDDHKFYSVSVDGGDRRKVSDDDTLYTSIFGDQIYYSRLGREKGIYGMKTDGSEKVKLSDDNPYGITAADGWVYYSNTDDDYKLYAVRTDGGDRRKVSDDYAPDITVVDGRIYYKNAREMKIYSMNTDGGDRQLLSDDTAEWLTVYDDRIYYTMTGTKIYSMNTDGSDKRILTDLTEGIYKEVTYEINARPHVDMPEYRFVVTGMVRGTYEWGVGYVMGLAIFNENGDSILSADFSETYYDEVTGCPVYNEMMDTMGLHVADVNFDGYKDVIILSDFGGAHGNTWYNCWLWDAKTSAFVESESFAGICNPALDPEKKCVYSAGGSGAACWGGSIYKFIDGEFVVTNSLDADDRGLVEEKLVNGEMKIVREVSYDEWEQELEQREYYDTNELWQFNHPRWYMVGGHQANQWLGG